MSFENWMAWEGGVDLVAVTEAGLAMPNVIVHVARMVHTPAGSAPAGMLFWQPDPKAAPLVFGFVSPDPAVGAYFGKHIFAGTPFEAAPVIQGTINISIDDGNATAKVSVPGFEFSSHLSDFSAAELINRTPLPTAPFNQQGLERNAKHACLKVNGAKIEVIVPPVSMSGGYGAVFSPCGVYAR